MNRKLTLLLGAALAVAAHAQSDAPKEAGHDFYRLDFALKEMDGAKLLKTHNYQVMVMVNDRGTSSIRSGAKVPVVTDAKTTTYIDVGVNLDIRMPTLRPDGMEMDIIAEASGTLDAGTAPLTKQPMIYETKWNSKVLIPIGKPTLIYSSDDPASKHQLQLEVTATPNH